MIQGVISKLMTEANEKANAKAFWHEDDAKALKSQADKTAIFDKFTARIDEFASMSVVLKDAVAELQKELAEIDKAQAEATEATNAVAFCDEENAMARKSQAEKTALFDKFTAHIDEPFTP